jgi:hypothetical protein
LFFIILTQKQRFILTLVQNVDQILSSFREGTEMNKVTKILNNSNFLLSVEKN